MDHQKLIARLEELRKKHRKLDIDIQGMARSTITEEVRRLKTEKLWLKDEIYRIEKELNAAGVKVNGYH